MIKNVWMILFVALALNIWAQSIHLVDLLLINLDFFYPITDIIIRFNDLLLIMGFIGLFIVMKKHNRLAVLFLCYPLILSLSFFSIEFNLFNRYDFVINCMVALSGIVLIFLIKHQFGTKEIEHNNLSRTLMLSIYMYVFMRFILSALPYSDFGSAPRTTESVLPIFYIFYQLLFLYYLYNHRNKLNAL